MTQLSERPKPFLFPEFCKGCGRCIEACPKHCISLGSEINPATGLIPVHLDLDLCNGCGLCLSACPEPYGLAASKPGADFTLEDPAALFGPRTKAAEAVTIPDAGIALAPAEPLVIKGTYASAIALPIVGAGRLLLPVSRRRREPRGGLTGDLVAAGRPDRRHRRVAAGLPHRALADLAVPAERRTGNAIGLRFSAKPREPAGNLRRVSGQRRERHAAPRAHVLHRLASRSTDRFGGL